MLKKSSVKKIVKFEMTFILEHILAKNIIRKAVIYEYEVRNASK